MNEKLYARALDFSEQAVYYPEKRPGYTAWVSLFRFGNGELGIAFNEIRRGRNPAFSPPSLEFVEAMAIPYRVCPDVLPASNQNFISEYVCFKSTDNGNTWEETGRCPVDTRHYWHVGFPDGRIVRAFGTQYIYTSGNERFCNIIEESTDGGNTWKEIARFLEGIWFYIHKLKKLSNGAVIAVGYIGHAFGPGNRIAQRNGRPPGQIYPMEAAFMVSEDGGYSWDGPHAILPGVAAWEPDFVELPDGALLFINSTVQGGRPARQIIRRIKTGWIKEPMMEISRGAPMDCSLQGGFTPETVVMMPGGLIVGARRSGMYSCSNDLGENWYEIHGASVCNYQPIIEALPDGRLLTAWHYGGDTRFGEIDMYIGTHVFRVEEKIPKPTSLSLDRELSADGNQYVNAFHTRLTAGNQPISNRVIELRVKETWLPQPDGRLNPIDVLESPDVHKAVTDENGEVRWTLKEKDDIRDIHHGYEVAASFIPDKDDDYAACRSTVRRAYPTTPARRNTTPYPVYQIGALIMITPETTERFPDLASIVEHFNVPDPDASIEMWIKAAGSEERAKEILDFLIQNCIISVDEQGVYHWYRAVHSGKEGESYIREVRICNLEEHCV